VTPCPSLFPMQHKYLATRRLACGSELRWRGAPAGWRHGPGRRPGWRRRARAPPRAAPRAAAAAAASAPSRASPGAWPGARGARPPRGRGAGAGAAGAGAARRRPPARRRARLRRRWRRRWRRSPSRPPPRRRRPRPGRPRRRPPAAPSAAPASARQVRLINLQQCPCRWRARREQQRGQEHAGARAHAWLVKAPLLPGMLPCAVQQTGCPPQHSHPGGCCVRGA
jgi:hypothetical protein